ncbi:MAG: Xaa-Pro peptidase family protein [Omnitrophica bacterium]|nr:Xaa-Pro peptidase family protein [Candidatus Omnitrophota bacterium]
MNPATINKLRQNLITHKLDGLLVTKEANISYLSGFRGAGQLLITPKKRILIVDFRFKEQAEKTKGPFQICQRLNFRPFEQSLSSLAKKLKLKRLGFESPWLPFELYRRFKSVLGPVKLVPTTNIVEELRVIKSPKELVHLKKAALLAMQSYDLAKRIIKPGRKEVAIARELQYAMRKQGAQDCSFELIIASGRRSSMPHATASEKVIKNNEAVLLDLGCRVSDYNSDLTRMVFLGKIRGKIKQIYEAVFQAQQLAIKAVKAGVKISEIDKIARRHLSKKGFRRFFGHALGHGIGREVHEYPSISPKNQDLLKEGMVFTIEPGVYIPGLGGIRVEDMVLVTKNGCEVLTKE